MSDSTQPGVILPSATTALDDQALDTLLQQWVVALSGLPGNLVRQRYQAAPPAMPPQDTNWAIVGFTRWMPDGGAWIGVDAVSEIGVSTMQRHEDMIAQVTFAGPACGTYAGLLRDGAQIRQNRVMLAAAGLQLVSVGQINLGPDLVNEVWVRRADIEVTIRRQNTRTYPIRRIDSADAPFLSNDPS